MKKTRFKVAQAYGLFVSTRDLEGRATKNRETGGLWLPDLPVSKKLRCN